MDLRNPVFAILCGGAPAPGQSNNCDSNYSSNSSSNMSSSDSSRSNPIFGIYRKDPKSTTKPSVKDLLKVRDGANSSSNRANRSFAYPFSASLCVSPSGINGAISSMTIEALNSNCSVLGFFEGFRQLKNGKSMAMNIEFNDVTRIYSTGGSMLRTSKQQLATPAHVDNCLRVLQHHRVRYLVTIGGTQTAYSSSLLVSAAAVAKYKLSVVHVPKSIFNDLPLGEGVRTFGFSTAREVGSELVQNFATDARTMLRWYILVIMGQFAGHLTLGIAKAGASTVTIIGEDYLGRGTPLSFNELATVLEGSIYKRRAMGKEYGVACISESLVSCMDPAEVNERFGSPEVAHSELGRHLQIELTRRFLKKGIDQTVVSRNVGNELRSAPPNASDITLTRDLGFAATRVLMEGGTNCLVTLKGGSIHVIPFTAILDPTHSSTQIRLVDTSSLSYQVMQSYSIVLRQPDLQDTGFLQKLARAANMTASEFLLAFQNVAATAPPYRQPQTAGVSYAFMQHAWPTLASGASAAPTSPNSLTAGNVTPQTQQQLAQVGPAAQHIVASAGPSRKGSERDAFSASPPLQHLHASAQHLQQQQHQSPMLGPTAAAMSLQHLQLSHRGSSAGMGSGTPGAGPASSDGTPSVGGSQPGWFQQTATLSLQSMRLSSSSPTPPSMLSMGVETPCAGVTHRMFPPTPASAAAAGSGATTPAGSPQSAQANNDATNNKDAKANAE